MIRFNVNEKLQNQTNMFVQVERTNKQKKRKKKRIKFKI